MPLLGTRGAASAKGFGFTALTGIGGPYWIGVLGGASADVGYGIAVDSSGNVYIAGSTASQGPGFGDAIIAKYNNSGVIQWQRVLGGASADDRGYGVAVDSSGNVYVAGQTQSQGAGQTDVLITKYNASGTIQWQRTLGGSFDDSGNGITVDSSGNVYITGYASDAVFGAPDVLIAKYNTSGTIQWQRTLGVANYDDVGNGIAIDSSGNIYVTGYTFSPSGGTNAYALVTKYDNSGAIQWQRILGDTNAERGYGVSVDSSGNVYITGFTNTSGSNDVLIAKYNPSGTIQWRRSLGATSEDRGTAIVVDSSGNIYVTGYAYTAANYNFVIAKYDTSGTIQWQRSLGGSSSDLGYGIALDPSNNVYVTGYAYGAGSGLNDVLIAKLPNDGSKTGTYTVGGGSITYAASSLTASTITITSATSSLTSSTSTLTDAASTLTSSTSTLTSSVTTI
jgi:uncharacterized delta-60 repeat protein